MLQVCSCYDNVVAIKSLLKFYETVSQAIVRHVRFDVVKCVLVASPGFVKVGGYHGNIQESNSPRINSLTT